MRGQDDRGRPARHGFIDSLSGNPLIAPALATHWSYTQRIMDDIIARDQTPRDIWDQHARILEAIVRGDGDAAEALACEHIAGAASFLVKRLRESV